MWVSSSLDLDLAGLSLATEARAEALQLKVAEAEKARETAEGAVAEMRASLGVAETARATALSEHSNAQQLILGALSLFLLSHDSTVGSPIPGHHEPYPPLLCGTGQQAALASKRKKVLLLEEEVENGRQELNRLWRELKKAARVSEEDQTALAEREQELGAMGINA